MRFLRRARQWLARRRVRVLYSPAYRHTLPGTPVDPLRAERILTFLGRERLVGPKQVTTPAPVGFDALRLVHDDAYLHSLTAPSGLHEVVGYPLSDDQQLRLIASQRAMVGGTIAATRAALQEGVAVNLGGGLHHARRDRGKGFCALNDVAVAIATCRRQGFDRPVLVVDLDLHDGDGTRTLFAEDPTVHTLSLHNFGWEQDTAIASTSVELGSEVDDETYLRALDEHLGPTWDAVRPGLVFYLAGADPAADDRLGDGRLTLDGLFARDARVWRRAREPAHPVPLVVLLAGGYGPHAWRSSARFLSYLLHGAILPLPSSDAILIERYQTIARLLPTSALTGDVRDDDLGLTPEDLAAVGGGASAQRFLGYYSLAGVELGLEATGVIERLRDLGFPHPHLELDLLNPSGHTLRVFRSIRDRAVLIEVRLRRDRRTLEGAELLSVEWMLLQNPGRSFDPERPRLPGQRHPGLGLLKDAVALLVQVCERLHLDGLVFVPSHYHVAAQSRKYLRFLRPEDEARFDALLHALADLPLAAASLAVHESRVLDGRTDERVSWPVMPMILPLSPALAERMDSAEFTDRVAAFRATLDYRVEPEPRPALRS